MHRTQLYLPDTLAAKLRALSTQQRKSVSQLVREAIEATYMGSKRPPVKRMLKKTQGLWRDHRDVPIDAFIRNLRDDTRSTRSSKHA